MKIWQYNRHENIVAWSQWKKMKAEKEDLETEMKWRKKMTMMKVFEEKKK